MRLVLLPLFTFCLLSAASGQEFSRAVFRNKQNGLSEELYRDQKVKVYIRNETDYPTKIVGRLARVNSDSIFVRTGGKIEAAAMADVTEIRFYRNHLKAERNFRGWGRLIAVAFLATVVFACWFVLTFLAAVSDNGQKNRDGQYKASGTGFVISAIVVLGGLLGLPLGKRAAERYFDKPAQNYEIEAVEKASESSQPSP